MNEYTVTANEQGAATHIRKQYESREANKMEQLRRLDGKVKGPGRVLASILGSVGALVMGAGMSLVMVWGSMTAGLVLGIGGMLLALLAWPVYTSITGKRKRKYAADVLKLSDEVLAL